MFYTLIPRTLINHIYNFELFEKNYQYNLYLGLELTSMVHMVDIYNFFIFIKITLFS